jgi:hypothetical protein
VFFNNRKKLFSEKIFQLRAYFTSSSSLINCTISRNVILSYERDPHRDDRPLIQEGMDIDSVVFAVIKHQPTVHVRKPE